MGKNKHKRRSKSSERLSPIPIETLTSGAPKSAVEIWEGKAKAFQITAALGCIGNGSPQAEADYELKILKSIALYADEVNLVSLQSATVAPILMLTRLTPGERLQVLQHCLPSFKQRVPKPDLFEFTLGLYAKLLDKQSRYLLKRQELTKLRELNHLANYLLKGAQEELIERLDHYNIKSYGEAVTSGCVSLSRTGLADVDMTSQLIETFLGGPSEELHFEMINGIVTEFICSLSLAQMGTTHLLLDAGIFEGYGSLVLKPLQEESSDTLELRRARHVALASDLMARLPLLEAASFAEIVDIRCAYEGPLKRFRAALMGLSTELNHLPWERSFALEADDLFRSRLEPAITEIEDEFRANSFVREIAKRVTGVDLTVSSGSALGVALSSLWFLPDAMQKTLGVALSGGVLLSESYLAWQEKQRETEKQQLVFYYQAGRRLQQFQR